MNEVQVMFEVVWRTGVEDILNAPFCFIKIVEEPPGVSITSTPLEEPIKIRQRIIANNFEDVLSKSRNYHPTLEIESITLLCNEY